jgi:hypothetical protein
VFATRVTYFLERLEQRRLIIGGYADAIISNFDDQINQSGITCTQL